MAKGAWALTGAAVTDPGQFARSWTGLATLADIAEPQKMGQAWTAFGKSFTDWNEWSTDAQPPTSHTVTGWGGTPNPQSRPDRSGRALGHVIANAGAVALGTESLAGDAGEAGVASEAGAVVRLHSSLDGVTGEASEVGSLLKSVDGVNPRLASGDRAYQLNCTHCVQATGLRLRGVDDAEAKPLPRDLISAGGRGLDSIEVPWTTSFSRATKESIEQHLLARGNGADGVVAVRWADRAGGHVFNAVNIDGKVHYIDGQCGSVDVSGFFDRANPDKIQFAPLVGLPSDTVANLALSSW